VPSSTVTCGRLMTPAAGSDKTSVETCLFQQAGTTLMSLTTCCPAIWSQQHSQRVTANDVIVTLCIS